MQLKQSIEETLLASGKISSGDLQKARDLQKINHQEIRRNLMDLGLISEENVLETLSLHLGIPRVSLKDIPSEPFLHENLSTGFLREVKAFPLKVSNGKLSLVMADPLDSYTIDAITLATGQEIDVLLGKEEEILSALEKVTASDPSSMEKIIDDLDQGDGGEFGGQEEDPEHLRDIASEAPVIRLVNMIISKAVDSRASDIHLEPFEKEFKLRFRIDGILQETESLPKRLQAAIISRIKIMAKLNIAERRLPQDGRIKIKVSGSEVDFRISTLPTLSGESVVMRILNRESVVLDLKKLGFAEDTLELFTSLVTKPYGMILVTGPTGSGKTTSLYGVLDILNIPDKKIITLEDPVEYQFVGVNQIQVKPQIGLTFASGLRSIVRQDPDIILIGEIRDGETAEIAIHSSLTGHLVFSTLHTNDAAGAITRLLEMGVENYLLSSSILGVLAQRLVRVVCPVCKEKFTPPGEWLQKLGFHPDDNQEFFRGKGCENCNFTGYRGRIGIYELMIITDSIRSLILKNTEASAIKQQAVQEGMRPLREDGWEKIKMHLTTPDEILRVTLGE